MLIWSLVFEKVVSLYDLENYWSLDDVMRANAVLNIKFEYMQEVNSRKK
ncbi:MAG: hypothetical protein QXF82_04145 [Nitrososphaeria archaeon]